MRWERPDSMTANAMLVSGLMIAQMTEAKAVRDSVFLTHFPATALPVMTLAAATFAMIASYGGSRIMRATTPDRFAPAAFFVSGLLQIGERSLLLASPRAAACLIFLHVFAINLMLTSSFWSLMNEHYDPRSAKKSFGKIGGMGTFGGIVGGLIAERVAALGSVPALILVTGSLHMACGGALYWFTQKHQMIRREENRTDKTPAVREVLKRSPYLMELAALMISVSVAAGLVDYLFKSQAASIIAKGPTLTRFFALFYTATGLLGVALQAFAAPVLLSRLGLANTVSSLPFAIVAAGGWVLAFPGLVQFTILRGLEAVVRSSLYRSGYELFYTPVPAAEKRAVKGIIDINGERLGDAIGSGIIGLFLVLHLGGQGPILGMAIAFSVAGLILARRLERSYTGALEKSLRKQSAAITDPELDEVLNSVIFRPGRLSPSQAAPDEDIPRSDAVLRELMELRSNDEARVIRSLMRIQIPHPALIQPLIQLLANNSYAFLAMEKLGRAASDHVGQLADALLNPGEPFRIRKRVPLILSKSGSQRALEPLVAALSDEDFVIRFRSAHAIHQLRIGLRDLRLDSDRILSVVAGELEVSREVWEGRRLVEEPQPAGAPAPGQSEKPGDASLEYLFVLLGLVFPREPVSMAYRALQTQDKYLRGTALEYLQTVLPGNTWKSLESLIANRTITRRPTKIPMPGPGPA